jgi:hypothetical protein
LLPKRFGPENEAWILDEGTFEPGVSIEEINKTAILSGASLVEGKEYLCLRSAIDAGLRAFGVEGISTGDLIQAILYDD